MKKSILFFFFLIIINALYTQNQKAEIVFNDGTSLEGYGSLTRKDQIKFRLELNDTADIWDYEIVKGIYFYEFKRFRYFEFVKTKKDKKPELLEVIATGEITLYLKKNQYTNLIDLALNNGEKRIAVNKNFKTYSTSNLNSSKLNSYSGIRIEKFFVKRQNEKTALNFKKITLNYFRECEVMKDSYDSKEYKKMSPKELIDQYNIYCTD